MVSWLSKPMMMLYKPRENLDRVIELLTIKQIVDGR